MRVSKATANMSNESLQVHAVSGLCSLTQVICNLRELQYCVWSCIRFVKMISLRERSQWYFCHSFVWFKNDCIFKIKTNEVNLSAVLFCYVFILSPMFSFSHLRFFLLTRLYIFSGRIYSSKIFSQFLHGLTLTFVFHFDYLLIQKLKHDENRDICWPNCKHIMKLYFISPLQRSTLHL